MKRFAASENTSALFHEKVYFPCMEELQVIRVNDEVMGQLWDKQSLSVSVTSNPAPRLRQLALSNSADVLQIPSVILENITSLKLAHFQGGDFVFPLSNSGENEGLLLLYSQLEEVKVEESKSLKELFDKKDCNAISDVLSSFCRQIKTLELNTLPSLNRIPLELFKSIVSVTLFGLKWDYIISAHFHEDSLRQLQFLSIEYCHSMKALVENVDSQINLYNLKHLRLRYLSSFIGISSMPDKKAALNLPSLEMLEIENLHTPKHFWKGSIDAPKLQEISLSGCYSLKQFLVGNIKDTIQLPSLKKVNFCSCPCMEAFSSGSVRAPKLREVKLQGCCQMQYFFPENRKPKGNLELPSLEIVDIDACYNLRSFSVSRVLAPKLTRITFNKIDYYMQSADKLNGFL